MEVSIKGTSMEPFIKEGDTVKVLPQKFYIFGDVLLFFNFYGKIWCHRFLGISFKDGKILFHLKGDNSVQKEVIPTSNIIGRVIYIKRNGKILKISSFKNFYLWCINLWKLLKIRIKN